MFRLMPIFNSVFKSFYERKPWSNTVAYYKLDGNWNDSSGNWYNLTIASNVSYDTSLSSWQKVAYFTGSNSYLRNNSLSLSLSNITISIWLKKTRNATAEIFAEIMGGSDFRIENMQSNLWNIWFNFWQSNSNRASGYNSTGVANDVWRNVVLVWDWSTIKLYQNEQPLSITYTTWSSSVWIWTYTYNSIVLWGRDSVFGQWYISEVIFENKARTVDEISGYYNRTKWNYGL